ncbi:MAG: insulinase family protein [Rhodospirillales bacterium]|nr:insulinase family protein [Rhodospirillales bacterium]
MNNSTKLTTLPSGLRVITDTVKTVESAVIGVWVDVGTRYEDMRHNGVAHMVEHMMFKGTPTRSARDIAEQIENVGGSMNAYTSHEVTAYHMHVLKEDVGMALDMLADMLQRPAMPEDEIERERDVILQEIGMKRDAPDDYVFDLWQQVAFPGQPLGAPILGTAEIVANMGRDTLMDYVRTFYTPGRMVISAAGNVDHEALVAQVEKHFTALPADTEATASKARYEGGEARQEKDMEQSHIVLGFEGLPHGHDDYYAAVALAIILGGGFSSRLHHEIREKRGLVYSVYGFHNSYRDVGEMIVYAGTGPDKLPELVPVLCDELTAMRNFTAGDELDRAKAMLKASLLMAQESMMGRANRQVKHLFGSGTVVDIVERRQKIEAVTIDDVGRVAQKIFGSKPALAALGPLGRLESYDDLTGRFAR